MNQKNVWDLSHEQRYELYNSWLNLFIKDKLKEADTLNSEFNLRANILKELKLQEDLSIMRNSYIIAMTTTGSSRYHSVLKDIVPRIIIAEEAAEIFESHIVFVKKLRTFDFNR